VYCQLVYLRGCHPGRIRHALSELPETLDETYERTLREINKADWELAHRLFQCVAVASRPLQVEELAEFLAFDFTAGPVAKFQEGWRLEDPVDEVLSTCSTLLALVNVDGSAIIQFSHFSVKEFLTSTRLAKADDENLRRYTIFMTPAHTLITQASLGMLLHLDETITKEDLTKYPLAEYAGRHWFEHARFENVAQEVEEGLKVLFDPDKPHLSIWVWICDPRTPSMDSDRAERPSAPGGTPLHYAAVCGLQNIAKFLAIEHPGDLNSGGFNNESTPLHVASTYGHVEVARVLTEQGVDMAARNDEGYSPLHVASKNGHVDVARFLVEHGADMLARDNSENTPLHVASLPGHVEVARLLVEHGADVSARDNGDVTPLHVASTNGHAEIVSLLVDHGASLTHLENFEKTALHEASIFGHVNVARFLIDHGADTNASAKDGRTPLHFASSYGYMDIARILLEHGANASAQADDGKSPLHVAASYGNVEISRFLVEHGADVTARTSSGRTPLHFASSCGSVQVARFLIERGADPIPRDKDGRTPWDEAATGGHAEFARFLVEVGGYPTPQDDENLTPSEAGTEEVVEAGQIHVEIIEPDASADATSRANHGWSPLHVAVGQGNADVVRVFVEHGMDVAARADDGWTPLHVAVSQGNADVVRILVEHGADATARANDGRSPLHMAAEAENVEVVRILLLGQDTGTDSATVTDTTTAQSTQGRRLVYPITFLTFCLVVGISLHFMQT
jgi:ankyrin repeat protein